MTTAHSNPTATVPSAAGVHTDDHPSCSCASSLFAHIAVDSDAISVEIDTVRIDRPARAKPAPEVFPSSDTIRYFEADRIHTMDPDLPEAVAVRVRGQIVDRVYSKDDWDMWLADPACDVDKTNRCRLLGVLTPGFYECHMHPLLDGLLANAGVDLRDCNNKRDMLTTLRGKMGKAANGRHFILGYNVDPLSQPVPTDQTWASVLDEISSDDGLPVYVLVEHNSMHIWYVNTALMQLICDHNPELTTGKNSDKYFPKKDGKFTGVVQEDEGIAALISTLTAEKLLNVDAKTARDAIVTVARQAQAVGCTTITDAMLGSLPGDLSAYLLMSSEASREDFPVRLVAHPYHDSEFAKKHMLDNPALNRLVINDRLELGAIKYVVDGSLQGGTAYNPPYRKDGFEIYFNGDRNGVLNLSLEQLQWRLRAYKASGYQPMIHTNSTAAIQIALDALAFVYSPQQLRRIRPRIEHCQVPTEAQLRWMSDHGVQANFLINHVWYWGRIYSTTLLNPKVAQSISPMKTAIDVGLRPALHSDAYVSPLDPLRLMWTAVNRRTKNIDGTPGEVLAPAQRVTPYQALQGITVHAAALDFADDRRGVIKAGGLADMTHMLRDPLTVDPEKIIEIDVEGTVFGGHYCRTPAHLKRSARGLTTP